MEDKCTEEKKPALSFGFAKKQTVKQLPKSIASENVEKEETETDYVLSLEGRKVKSTKGNTETIKKEYVIPLIKQNRWRREDNFQPQENGIKLEKRYEDANSSPSGNLDELAAQEILKDTAKYNEHWHWEERGKEDTTIAIPLLMQNKVPGGFELDEKLDVTLRPEEPHEADYEQIPIEHFGMAMLRGMGWTETRGVGKNGKIIAPVEAHLRPKGLGLGADRNNAGPHKISTSDKDVDKDENLILKKNAFCFVTAGTNKDLYGIVEGLDEDNSRVMVKLTLNGKIVNIMQCNVRVVGRKEYDNFSKYLNKQKADKYKESEEKRIENGHVENGHHRSSHKSKSHKHHKRKREHSDKGSDSEILKRKSKKHKRDKSRERNLIEKDYADHVRKNENNSKDNLKYSDSKSSSKSNKHQRETSSGSEDQDNSSIVNISPWLRNDLRVRVIDKELKKGKYYKEKVVIIDVPSLGKCVCRTDDGKVIEDVPQSALETVIPRSDHAYVAIVTGSHQGQIGHVMKRDKERCQALIQLLSDRDVVLKLMYDDICEFVGNIHNEDDY